MSVNTDDFATFAGIPSIDEDRAQMLLDAAVVQAMSIITVGTVPDSGATEVNLPTGAEYTIYAAVSRLYQNPTGVSQEVTGPYTFSRAIGSGALFSKAEVAALRRLAGRSGAFSIDLLPAGYPESVFDESSSASSSSSSS